MARVTLPHRPLYSHCPDKKTKAPYVPRAMRPYLLELTSELRAPRPPSLAPVQGIEALVSSGEQKHVGICLAQPSSFRKHGSLPRHHLVEGVVGPGVKHSHSWGCWHVEEGRNGMRGGQGCVGPKEQMHRDRESGGRWGLAV